MSFVQKNVIKGDIKENTARLNNLPENEKVSVCPWNAIEVHPYKDGVEYSKEYYPQARESSTAPEIKEPQGQSSSTP